MNARLFHAFAILSASALVACDSSDGGGVGSLTLSQPAETNVATLSDSEKTTLCNEVATYFLDEVSQSLLVKLSCTTLALGFTSDAAACAETRSQCIANPAGLEPSTVECDIERMADCTATVGELQACYEAQTALIKRFATTLSCTTDRATLQGMTARPQACASVQAKCPNLFDED